MKCNNRLKELSFSFLPLKKGERRVVRSRGRETLITLLSGEIAVAGTNGLRCLLGPRSSVFAGPSTSVYIGLNDACTLEVKRHSEIVCVTAETKKKYDSFPISQKAVKKRTVGKPPYCREVHTIISEEQPTDKIIAGETFNMPGQWSSFPPHKHDKARYPHETKLEEVYFFKIFPKDRFALMYCYQRVRGKINGTVHALLDNDTVAIPSGYHPVSAPPGTQVYYYWALAGKRKALRMAADEAFSEQK